MTKEEIVIEIYNSEVITSYCKTLSWYDYEELQSELVAQLLKMNEQKLQLAEQRGFLHYLCFKIVKRIVWGNVTESGIFRGSNKSIIVEVDNLAPINTEPEIDVDKIGLIFEELEKQHWYSKTLFKMYYQEGLTLRQISERTGINQKSIHYAIKKTREKIKKKLNP